MNIWPGVHFISFEFNFSRVRRGLVFSWVCTITPVLFVCIFLVILAPVSSSAHYLLQLFPRSDFFLLSNEWVLKCSEVQYFPQNILKPRSDYTILARFWDDLFVVGCLEDSYTTMGVGTQDSIVSSRVVCHSARQPMSCLRCFTT